MDFKKYEKFIRERFQIVNKEGKQVPFVPNAIQQRFLDNASKRDIILKARQMGFSSLILAIFTTDFLMKPDSFSVVVADIADNAMDLLDRVKRYIKTYEEITGVKVPLKYNSKYEIVNAENNAKYIIGTADNVQFGRSKTITNLHLSEAAFYRDLDSIMASAESAVVENGWVVIETTANGFNELKTLWDNMDLDPEAEYKNHFFAAEDFYDEEYLNKKRKTRGRLYDQEFPSSALSAFVTSGQSYFDKESLSEYLKMTTEVMV